MELRAAKPGSLSDFVGVQGSVPRSFGVKILLHGRHMIQVFPCLIGVGWRLPVIRCGSAAGACLGRPSPPPTDVGPLPEPSGNGTAEANTEQHGKQMKPEPVHAPLMHVRRFRKNMLKVGGRMTRHARYLTFYLAESAKKLWETFWENTWKLRWQTLCWPSLPRRC